MTWNTNELVQFGAGTNWQQVMGDRTISSVLLLKKDGTLWRWGDRPLGWVHLPPGWQGLRACTPQQIGTNSDWQRLAQVAGSAAAQKTDGSVWHLWFDTKAHTNVFELVTNMSLAGFTRQRLDDTKLTGDNGAQAGVRADGTLWIWGHLYWDWQHANRNGDEALQSGRETNWVAVALHNGAMVALKSDGTLWGWGRRPDFRQPADAFTVPPVRLGSHQDWVALAQTWEGIVSLAADGSLWLWPDYAYHSGVVPLIEPSQRPIPLGNILATASK
jgi:alpha-tubulin suppressor-like RCC1 family protein